ncbi:Cysteine-rich receptor-like protein kinase 2 [Nymphaea thermarum]|nr:Cysteine-rich receptor-like protein kinase 2 [Nymphaea thermarum]
MGRRQFLLKLILCIEVGSFLSAMMADPRTDVAGLFCDPDLAVSGDVLASNFVPAMANLSSLIDRKGYGTTVVGSGPNAVYGLAQCMKDLSSIDCRLCFSEMRSLLPTCYPRIGGRIFLDGCFARYDNYSFFDVGKDSEDKSVCLWSRNNSNAFSFVDTVREVSRNVSLEAQRNQGFAVGSSSDSTVSVYALAQCWQNLNSTLCKSCLDDAASSIVSCAPAVEGRALKAGCYMRYSINSFWNMNQTSSHSSGPNKSFWTIMVSAGSGVFIVAGLLIWKFRALFRRSNDGTLKDLYGSGLSTVIAQSKLNYSYDELRNATNDFNSVNRLGQGGYGTVYKGVLSDGREVAVKRLFINTRQWADQFLNEVDLISRARHKNLVKLLGCSLDGPESLLVYEYCQNKTLDLFIFDPFQRKKLGWCKRLEIIQGIAEGLSYLHEESCVRIIHRDIKASNVLLDEKFKPKITDFGLARSFAEDQTHLSTGIAGTLGYMAPEYIVHGQLTEKADVYSFGVLVLEIVTGLQCSNSTGSSSGQFLLAKIWSHYKANNIEEILDECVVEKDVEEMLHVVQVGLLCTQAIPSLRPSMSRVVEMLRDREEEEVVPSDPPFLDILSDCNNESEASILLSVSSKPSVLTPSISRSQTDST